MPSLWCMSIIVATIMIALEGAILPPPWADPTKNPCANLPGGWLLLYWPQDGKCYRIFQKGTPCPQTMELTPGLNGTAAQCKCPPGQAHLEQDHDCYPINAKGPCRRGEFFAPMPDSNSSRIGICKGVDLCSAGQIFWPATKKCYNQFTKGACSPGQLLVLNKETGLGECSCNSEGPMGKHHWPHTKTCHQFYTRGPCLEKGSLFLPGPQCGCNTKLPHYYPSSSQCYEIGTTGPCKPGQVFMGEPHFCMCKPYHVSWKDGNCYRMFTKGPCFGDQILTAQGECQKLPCSKGKLYFPEEDNCYQIGVRGPCPEGQLVLFEQSVRPSVEGISYRGMCGCPGKNECPVETTVNDLKNEYYEASVICMEEESCYELYKQGPCPEGAWLVPLRQPRDKRELNKMGQDQHYSTITLKERNEVGKKVRAQCECRPQYSKLKTGPGCRLPLFALAQFLNGKDYFN